VPDDPCDEPTRRPLLVIGQPAAERADAARNRQKILDAAMRLLAATGTSSLSLDEVAREAGVGVGTVYRRFGDRAGLLSSLIDKREREFQQAVMTGPPPLGPGAPAAERIRVFLHALLSRQEEQWQLLLLREKSMTATRYGAGPHQMYRAHLVTLIGQVDPDADAHYVAEALLALLAPSLLNYQIRELGFTDERMKAGLARLLARLLPARD
jgi:AcrR family transcriptional regulator